MKTNVKRFGSDSEIADYYNQRFESNYMSGWDSHIESKIRTFLKKIDVPQGTWLDFGCGQGSLTKLLKSIHSTGHVEGCDVSSVAIQRALERNPDITFSVWQSNQMKPNYNLIFSHHVLEHVLDLKETLDQLDQISTHNTYHCHVLPCGNKGSLEWQVANATQNGFEDSGRFFFEEDGHLRRLTSDQLTDFYSARGYRLVFSQFANQYYGGLKWIISLGPGFICDFADPQRGKSSLNAAWLYVLRLRLLFLWRMHYLINNRPKAKIKSFLHPLILPLAKGYVNHFLNLLDKEINVHCDSAGGSEMLMCFLKV
jgi:SAM-dependent methyltransferase